MVWLNNMRAKLRRSHRTIYFKSNYSIAWAPIFSVLFCLYLTSISIVHADDGISLSASLDRTEYPVNEVFTLALDVTWQGDAALYFVVTPPEPQFQNLELLESTVSNETVKKNKLTTVHRRYRYKLRGKETGKAEIKTMKLTYRKRLPKENRNDIESEQSDDPLSQYGESVTLEASPISITIMPADAPSNVPWGYIIAIVGIVMFGTLFIYSRKRYRQPSKVIEDQKDSAQQDHLLSIRQLVQTFERRYIDGEVKEFFADMEKEIQKFFHEYGMKLDSSMDEAELITMLGAKLDVHDAQLVGRFFSTSKLIRFGGFEPQQEEMRHLLTSLLKALSTLKQNELE